MPRPSAAFRLSLRSLPAIATLLVLGGCGGSGGSSGGSSIDGKSVSAGPDCTLVYPLTQAPELVGTDPELAAQWHLRNTGQSGGTAGEDTRATEAWSRTRGAGVRVAVVDDAVEVVHPDLWPNLVADASYSYRSGNRGSVWPLPCTDTLDAYGEPADGHGTAVAGLVLARDDNAVDGAGVAPRASLVAYDALSTSQDADIADALLRGGQHNAIYQNSWGAPDNGSLHPSPPSFGAAIRSGIDGGRGGLGAVYVFPSGNGGPSDNSNYDGFANQLGVIPVCAVDHTGRRPWYAEPGANVMVCAPSSGDSANVGTSTLRGGFRKDFSGTSASTPQVAGVVALMISANPALTWRDVRLILAQTARRNDPTDAGWESAANGLSFNHWYGFGVVDARAAVERAATWRSVGGSAAMKTCTFAPRTPALAIPDPPSETGPFSPATDAIAVAASDCGITQIEHVQVRVGITHTYAGDLRIRLRSPSGTASVLADKRACPDTAGSDPCGAYSGWTFGSVRHLGEPSTGTWTLEVTDLDDLDTGRLDSWSLTLHGR